MNPVAEAARLTRALQAAIDAGTIPSRPDPVQQTRAWRAWFNEHVRCEAHPYYQREWPHRRCRLCLAWSEHALDTLKTVEAVEFKFEVPVEPEGPQRVRRVRK